MAVKPLPEKVREFAKHSLNVREKNPKFMFKKRVERASPILCGVTLFNMM